MEKQKKRKRMFVIGVAMIVIGAGVLGFFAYRKVSRELYLRRLLKVKYKLRGAMSGYKGACT